MDAIIDAVKTAPARVRRGKKYWYCTILQIMEYDSSEKILSHILEEGLHENIILEVRIKDRTLRTVLTRDLLEGLKEDHQVFFYNSYKKRYVEKNPPPKQKRPKTVYGYNLEINVFGGIWVEAMTIYHWEGQTDLYPSQVFPFCTP